MSFDLKDFNLNESRLELKSLRGEGTGVFIRLLHMDSKEFQTKSRELRNKYAHRFEKLKIKNSQVEMDGKLAIELANLEEENTYELLASVTLGWDDLVYNGESYPFSYENAVKLYREFPTIKKQVELFIAEATNFIKSSNV